MLTKAEINIIRSILDPRVAHLNDIHDEEHFPIAILSAMAMVITEKDALSKDIVKDSPMWTTAWNAVLLTLEFIKPNSTCITRKVHDLFPWLFKEDNTGLRDNTCQ